MATGFPGSLHYARILRLTDVYWAAEDETILMEPIFDFSGTEMRPLSWETLLIRTKPGLSDKTWLIRPFKNTGGFMRD